jgi:hypothetical protein
MGIRLFGDGWRTSKGKRLIRSFFPIRLCLGQSDTPIPMKKWHQQIYLFCEMFFCVQNHGIESMSREKT